MSYELDPDSFEGVARHRPAVKQDDGDFDLLIDSASGESPEHDLWREFFALLIRDALGTTGTMTQFGKVVHVSKAHCVDCHLEQNCDCYVMIRGRLHRWPKRRCKLGYKGHSIQECARNFIMTSPVCEQYCALAGIDVSYLRQQFTARRFNAEITQPRKKKFLGGYGPGPKALNHPRLPDKARGAYRASRLGRALCS